MASQVMLDVAMLTESIEADYWLPEMVRLTNSLEMDEPGEGLFDLIIGNPPYGKITLSPEQREKYSRSLFGHANMYGLFADMAVRWVKPDGMIAYVTPTSFLGGQYFKALRRLLSDEVYPVLMEFIDERSGVFFNVLQETMLAIYKKKLRSKRVKVNLLNVSSLANTLSVDKVGYFSVPEDPSDPWMIPRKNEQVAILKRAKEMPHRLEDHGFTVSTGQLVWNRHKGQIKSDPGSDRLPLIWAESILPSGKFEFRSEKRNHKPYFELLPGQSFLTTMERCVLVQRTTSKEQSKRINAAAIPQEFLDKNPAGVVVENHVNILRAKSEGAVALLDAISCVLNSKVIDRVFRCISGSVAVSAYELQSIPLPSPLEMEAIREMISGGAGQGLVEELLARIYSVDSDDSYQSEAA